MIDVAVTEPLEAANLSVDAEQRNAHVLAYQRHLLHQLRDQRRGREAADRYDEAQATAHQRPGFTQSALAQAVVEARHAVTMAQMTLTAARTRREKTAARRVLKAANVRLTRAESAEIAEAKAETLAPAVQRRTLVQDGVVLREPRIEVRAGKRAELQPSLERLHNRRAIDVRQFSAGCRYRTAWEMAGQDAFAGGLGDGVGGGVPGSGNRRIEDAIGSSTDLTAARYAIGVFGTALLEHIVVEGLSLESWGARHGANDQVSKGQLIFVLNRLAEHWEMRPTLGSRVTEPIVFVD